MLISRLLYRQGPYRLAASARHLLLAYEWPGNIRQLEQVLRLAAALAGDEHVVESEHLPLS
ncbi:hypothetical protein [Pseudomonas duriflava]|uniref:hypothetical protein n=1 Tax=Pseudomonas duriflava TaxID=459528 RepID=UPI001FCAE512|nr:hypothetical protein [Pseudomonas duriflava]